jgi:DNA-binding SARP family transcriptional activator/streptogramin lyase
MFPSKGVTGSARVEVALLGPLECRIDGRVVAVRSLKQRAILGALALRASEVVSTDRLIAALWGEEPPAAARNSLEAHVSRLRRLLDEAGAPADVLLTRSPGYAFTGETDLARFERLRESATADVASGSDERAAEHLAAALALWRGAALADLADEPFATVESPRLDELRLAVEEELIRCRLALGQHAWAVPELEALVARHPLRERLRELLMLAYYRCGRQADALELYRETRDLLRRELGLEPGPSLRGLEQAILRHDPAVGLVAPAPADPGEPVPIPVAAPRRRRWARWVALSAAGIGGAIALGLLVIGGSHAHRLTRPQPLGKHLLASIPSPLPSCCAFGFGGVWVVGHHNDTVQKIDPVTNRVVAQYRVAGFQAHNPLMAVGSLWLPAAGEARFVRFDPARARVAATFPITSAEIAWGYGSMWVTTRDQHLDRIDYGSNKVVSRLRILPGVNDFDDGVAVGYGSVWVTAADAATLLRIDPENMTVIARISGFGNDYSWMPITVGDGSVWVDRITGGQGVLYRIDPYTNQIVKRIPVGYRGVAWPNGYILDAGGYVWTCDAGNTMSEVDPRSNRVVAWYKVPESCQEVAYGEGSIWTALYDHSLVYRIDPKP